MHAVRPSMMRLLMLAAAAIGAVSCLLATAASFWYATGATPALLYGPQIHRLATMVRFSNVPIEFVGLVWFTAVGIIYLFSPPEDSSTAYAWVFVTAVPIVAAAVELARSHLRTWSLLVATGAALIVLVVSGRAQMPPLRAWRRALLGDVARIARSPLAVAIVLCMSSATIIGAQFLSLKTATVSVTQASEQVFRRWFLSQARSTSAELVAPAGIKVVIFTDYQCPACASTVPAEEAVIDTFRKTHPEAIDIVYRDFPLESECNPTLKDQMHPAACESAVAVRLVGQRLGGTAAHDFGLSLYRNRAALSPEYIEARLEEHHLREDYRKTYPSLLEQVSADVALAQTLGVRATPTSFVNGTKMPSLSLRNFEMALQYEAERLSNTAPRGTHGLGGVVR